jgi:hypothetical protein
MKDTIIANVSSTLEAVNKANIYFMTSLGESLRIMEDWNIRFGDILGLQRQRQLGDEEKMRRAQEKAMKYYLFRCNVVSIREMGLPMSE